MFYRSTREKTDGDDIQELNNSKLNQDKSHSNNHFSDDNGRKFNSSSLFSVDLAEQLLMVMIFSGYLVFVYAIFTQSINLILYGLLSSVVVPIVILFLDKFHSNLNISMDDDNNLNEDKPIADENTQSIDDCCIKTRKAGRFYCSCGKSVVNIAD